MILEEIKSSQAEGYELLSPLFVQDTFLEKGKPLTERDVFLLKEAGIQTIVAVKPEEEEIGQNMASEILANELVGEHVYWTPPLDGLVRFYAKEAGTLNVNRERIERFNNKSDLILLTTKVQFSQVRKDELIATLYVAPPYIHKQTIRDYLLKLVGLSSFIRINPPKEMVFSFLRTTLESFSVKKQQDLFHKIQDKLVPVGGKIDKIRICLHNTKETEEAVEQFLHTPSEKILLISGAFPSIHRNDIIPKALLNAGVVLDNINIPMFPGFHLIKAVYKDKTIYILPEGIENDGLNSFDFLLRMLVSDIPVDDSLLRSVSVGGMLENEINDNPDVRRFQKIARKGAKIGVLVLAGGFSRRCMGYNKLLLQSAGTSLIYKTVKHAILSNASVVLTATGYQASLIEKDLLPLDTRCIANPDFVNGVNHSIALALNLFPKDIEGVLILPGDMPFFGTKDINRLIRAFEKDKVIMPTYQGIRRNPILWPKDFLRAIQLLPEHPETNQMFPALEKNIKEIPFNSEKTFFDLNSMGDFDTFLKQS